MAVWKQVPGRIYDFRRYHLKTILIQSSIFENSILVSTLEPVKAPSALTTVIIPHLEPEGTKELDKDGTGKNGKKT